MTEPTRAMETELEPDALSRAPIACHELDLEGRIVWVNGAECALLGLELDQVLGRPVWDFVAAQERESSRDAVIRKLSSEQNLEPFERTYLRPDGSLLTLEIYDSYRRDSRGAITGIRSFLVNVTQRKRAQDALRRVGEDLESRVRERTLELELAIDFLRREIDERRLAEEERRKLEAEVRHTQRLESIGVLAGGIAHEYNNLLTTIIGYASLAGLDLAAGSTAASHIERVLSAARSAADLTRQILAYAGRSQFVLEALDLSRLVGSTVRLIESMLSRKAVLKLSLAADPPHIEVDAGQMRQVILNLVTNASDALEDRPGEVRVSTGTYWAKGGELPSLKTGRIMPAGLYVYFEVADTGAGMDRETLDRIFEPFFSTKFTGRGLGLAAVLGIVRAHQGSIVVTSELNKGTTFRVYFPAVITEEPAGAGAVPAAVTAPGAGTVLVIDDEEPIRHLARAILETSGFAVLVAGDGAEAIDVFSRHSAEVHVVLLDVVMPGASASEVLAEIHRLNPTVKVLVSSGYNEEETAGRLGGLVPSGFLRKPYDPAELVSRIKSL